MKRFLSLLIAILMLLPALSACTTVPPEGQTAGTTETPSGEAVPTPEETRTVVHVQYGMDAAAENRAHGEHLASMLETLGYTVQLGPRDSSDVPAADYRVWIALSDEEDLGETGYAIRKEDNRLLIEATHPVLLELAVASVTPDKISREAAYTGADPFEAIEPCEVTLEDKLVLFTSGNAGFTVKADTSDADIERAASDLDKLLKGRFGEYACEEPDYTVELSKLPTDYASFYNLYAITVEDKTVRIASTTYRGLNEGVHKLCEILFAMQDGERLYYPAGLSFSHLIDDTLPALPKLSGCTVYDNNFDGSYTLALEDADRATFDAYTEKLTHSGYRLVEERAQDYEKKNFSDGSVTGTYQNHYRTYINDFSTVHAYYIEATGSMRVVGANISEYDSYRSIEAEAAPAGSETCDSFFAMLDIGGINEDKPTFVYTQGACLVWRLNDGRFIIVDCGQWKDNDLAATEVDRLYNFLLEHSVDGRVVVAAWILTHCHSDHINIMWKLEERYGERITIQHFLYNFPDPFYVLEHPGFTTIDHEYYTIRFPRMKDLLARYDCLVARTGRAYTFANATVEILFTHDDFYPDKLSIFNNSSTVFKITVDGTSFLIPGDLQEAGQEKASEQCGTLLDCDYIQATHHGYNGLLKFYQYGVNEKEGKTALWPLPVPGSTIKDLEANRWLMANATNLYSRDGIYLTYLPKREQ